MAAGRWRYRAKLWAHLVTLERLAADADTDAPGFWRVYELAAAAPNAAIATLSTADLHDLQAAGVTIVYRF